MSNPLRPAIAVSACLLGRPVRHDASHRRDRFVTDRLAGLLDLIPVCPELEAGLGVPRPTIHLRRINGTLRLTDARDAAIDHTAAMTRVAAHWARRLDGRISGYVVQQKSPSCGLERVAVADATGQRVDRSGTGWFAQEFIRRCPLVPIEESGRLNDPRLRENFLERVYALDRWLRLDAADVGGFIEFHSRHKLMLMARGSDAYTRLGRIVAGVRPGDLARRRTAYIAQFMHTLARRVSRGQHCNVLQHAMGHFKRRLSAADKSELLDLLRAYRQCEVPLAAPMVMLRHHLRNHPDPWLGQQHYLSPYPDGLALHALL